MLGILAGRRYQYTVNRDAGFEQPRPQNFYGPMVVMQNERSGSDAEMFPAGFKALGLGKVVGVHTAAAVIGTGSYTLLDGSAIRVPIPDGSIVDLTFVPRRDTTRDEVNQILKAASQSARLKGILEYVTAPLVSIDFRGNAHSSMIDSPYTKVMDGDFVKVLAWYDNEWGYSSRCVDLLRLMVKKGL